MVNVDLGNMPPEDWRINASYEPQKFYTTVHATEIGPTATFRTIEYNQPGEYIYSLKEDIPNGAEVSADGKTAVYNGIVFTGANMSL